GQTWHAHRVFFGRHYHRQVSANTTVDEADQLRFSEVMMIDVALRQIDMRAEVSKCALKTFGGCNRAERTDERVAQSLERQLFAGKNILKIKRFVRAFDNFRSSIVTANPSHQLEIRFAGIFRNKNIAGAAKNARAFTQRAAGTN